MIFRVFVVGFGNIGTNVAELLHHNFSRIKEVYNTEFRIVGAVDTSGSAIAKDGLNLETLVNVKTRCRRISDFPTYGLKKLSFSEGFDRVDTDILLELTSGDLFTGMPGIENMMMAINRGVHVVTTNKTSLARGFAYLNSAARKRGVEIKFGGAAHLTIPTVDFDAFEDLGLHITGVEALVNATSNFVLTAMSEGLPMDEAIRKAQAIGLAERDPTIDLNGWDTACKMVILADSMLKAETTLEDVKVDGIANLTREEILSAKRTGYAVKAVGEVETKGTISIKSTTKKFPASHFFATIDHSQKGMIFHTTAGDISIKTEQAGPRASALAIVRDMIDIAREEKIR